MRDQDKYLKEYYDIYFLPYTNIPFEQVEDGQKEILYDSVQFASFMLSHHYKQVVIEMQKSIEKLGMTAKKAAKSWPKWIKAITK